PSWAANYLLFVSSYVFLFYKGNHKLKLLSVYLLLFFFVGSTIGFLLLLMMLCYYYIFSKDKKFKLAFTVIFIIAPLLLFPILYGMLPGYTQYKIMLVIDLMANLSIKQFILIASSDWSFLARFMNPVIAVKMGLFSPIFG